MPKSVKISRNDKTTVAMAIVPKAAGEMCRARIAVIPSDMNIPEYFANAIQNTPFVSSSLIDMGLILVEDVAGVEAVGYIGKVWRVTVGENCLRKAFEFFKIVDYA